MHTPIFEIKSETLTSCMKTQKVLKCKYTTFVKNEKRVFYR